MEDAVAEMVMGTGTMVNKTSHRAFFDGFVMCSSRGWQCSHLSSAAATSMRTPSHFTHSWSSMLLPEEIIVSKTIPILVI